MLKSVAWFRRDTDKKGNYIYDLILEKQWIRKRISETCYNQRFYGIFLSKILNNLPTYEHNEIFWPYFKHKMPHLITSKATYLTQVYNRMITELYITLNMSLTHIH